MDNQVLVTFATKYGSTAGIAEKIHETFLKEGMKSKLQPVEQVNDLSPYAAVVLVVQSTLADGSNQLPDS